MDILESLNGVFWNFILSFLAAYGNSLINNGWKGAFFFASGLFFMIKFIQYLKLESTKAFLVNYLVFIAYPIGLSSIKYPEGVMVGLFLCVLLFDLFESW